MSQALGVDIGRATYKGIKAINQDYIADKVPKEPQLSSKGIVLAMADGISSSKVSQVASETAITSFIEDYYCTSESWSVQSAAQKVIKSINSLLCSQTRNSPYRFEKDKGYICTFSALILKSNSAYLFHSGDTRIYQLVNQELNQLTQDHRRIVSEETTYLTRALGIDPAFEADYQQLLLQEGNIFMLATDGVYEFITGTEVHLLIKQSEDLDKAAQAIIEQALNNGSDDNLSVQLVRVNSLPSYQLEEVHQLTQLPLPPRLSPRMHFDGYEILREIYISSRSHVFLAKDLDSEEKVVIKTPSTELREDKQYLEHFMLEEWIANRINNPHVAKAITAQRKRHFLYLVTEYIDGISLNQWMLDNPKPSLQQVRAITEQIAKGLQAFHRQEMLHQDIRPANIMIDKHNTVKIIDFGSTYIAGVTAHETETLTRGTLRYSAPEYFLGQGGSQASDIYALAVITYQMLSGKFPYSTKIAQANSISAQRKIYYRSLIDDESTVPAWIDFTLENALKINPEKRYAELSEFIHDLHQPNKAFLSKTKAPLLQRDPVKFWKGLSLILTGIVIFQAVS